MGWHPIHYAVVGGNLDAVKLLVEKGADVAEHLKLLVDWGEDHQSIIRYVKQQAKLQNAKLAKSALAPDPKFAGIPEIDRPDWLGFPPIVDASRGNHNATDDPDRVKELIDAGADVNVTDHKGKTALHLSLIHISEPTRPY